MKKIIIAFLALISLTSCGDEQLVLDKMEAPIVVVAIDKTGNDCLNSGAITLRDGKGKLWSFDCVTDIARSVSNSRVVGDTLK